MTSISPDSISQPDSDCSSAVSKIRQRLAQLLERAASAVSTEAASRADAPVAVEPMQQQRSSVGALPLVIIENNIVISPDGSGGGHIKARDANTGEIFVITVAEILRAFHHARRRGERAAKLQKQYRAFAAEAFGGAS